MSAKAFQNAVLAGDEAALAEVLADDVVFRSPAVFKPYEGRDATMLVLRAVSQVFEDFRYEDRFEGEDGEVLLFSARVGDRELNGIDLLRFDADGKVRELIVMIRPLSGLNALVEAMARELERLGVPVPGRS
jgi:SnoaL-like domain